MLSQQPPPWGPCLCLTCFPRKAPGTSGQAARGAPVPLCALPPQLPLSPFSSCFRETASQRVFQSIQQILMKSSCQVELACQDTGLREHLDLQLRLIAECFRCLRNACVQCPGNQGIIRNLNLIGTAVELMGLFQKLDTKVEPQLTESVTPAHDLPVNGGAWPEGFVCSGQIQPWFHRNESQRWAASFPPCLTRPS
ncbi:ataxin-10-like [Petaurus breviceps papuanus]|uniref:ataxin-10-like n=1 Tax=Petaurus breviceps papuanus TaxID=3040969 RepID=UPI0036DD8FFD